MKCNGLGHDKVPILGNMKFNKLIQDIFRSKHMLKQEK